MNQYNFDNFDEYDLPDSATFTNSANPTPFTNSANPTTFTNANLVTTLPPITGIPVPSSFPSQRARGMRRRGVFHPVPTGLISENQAGSLIGPTGNVDCSKTFPSLLAAEQSCRQACAALAIQQMTARPDLISQSEVLNRKEVALGVALPASGWLILTIFAIVIILSIFVRMVVLRFTPDEKQMLDYARPTLNNVVFSFVLVMVGQMLLTMLSSTSTMAAALDAERLNLVEVRQAFASMPPPWRQVADNLSPVPAVAGQQLLRLMGQLDACGVQFPSRDYTYPLIEGLQDAIIAVRVQYNVLARTDQNCLLALAILTFMTFSLFSLSRATPEGAIFAVSLLGAAIVSLILIVESQRSALVKRINRVRAVRQVDDARLSEKDIVETHIS